MPQPTRNPVPGAGARVRAWLRSPVTWMIVLALAARLLRIVLLRTYQVPPDADYLRFGWEMGHIARSLALGEGFGSPFGGQTGPTAITGPVYPFLLALVFRCAGIFTAQAAFWILALNSLFSALTCAAIYHIGRLTVGRRPALLAGWFFALAPHAMHWATGWIWDMSLSALLCALMFWALLELDCVPSLRRWCWFGVVTGVAALDNAAIATLAPFGVFWLAWRRPRETVRGAALAALIALLLATPWLVRNRVAFGQWVFLRSNFGFELWYGNHPGGNAIGFGDHPGRSPREFEVYRREGELAYFAPKSRQAFAYIAHDPAGFLARCAYRFRSFWDGDSMRWWQGSEPLLPWHYQVTALMALGGLLLAFERRMRAAGLYCWLVLYPLPYYIAFVQPRYRHPIDPELLLLDALFCVAMFDYARQRLRRRRALTARAG